MLKSIKEILTKITDEGFQAYAVGGYPRDQLLNRESTDVDISTDATPRELKKIFPKLIMPKIKYGSVTMIYNNIRFEITTFRTEEAYLDYRKPSEVSFTSDLHLDLIRRDFTINTLCMNVDGEILDLLNSKCDIEKKVVKMVGDPSIRLKEDVLRILRAIRFATILGFDLDEELKDNIMKYGYLLKKLSYERKKEELDKIFSSKNIKHGLDLIDKLGLSEPLEINLQNVVITSSNIGIWAQLGCLDKYKFNAHDYEFIKKINEAVKTDLTINDIYKYGLYVSSIAAEINGIGRNKIAKLHASLQIRSKKEIEINGSEIASLLNKEPGRYIKEILNDLEYNIVNGKINNKKLELKDYILKKYM